MLLSFWEVLSLVLWLAEYLVNKGQFCHLPEAGIPEGNSVLSQKTDLSIVLKTEQSIEFDGS